MLELACVPVLGRVHGYTEAFPTGQLVYLFVCTLAVDAMLFFGEFLLMLWVGNPLPALCVGIVGALVGLFSAFMPPLASYFVPFGYYIPLSAYEVANWDKATHTVTYGTRPFNWGLLAFTPVSYTHLATDCKEAPPSRRSFFLFLSRSSFLFCQCRSQPS